MKTIYVKYYNPMEVMDEPFEALTKKDVVNYCFRVAKYPNELCALEAYANTMCTWSTLLDENANVEWFIECAYIALKNHDIDWLEQHFT